MTKRIKRPRDASQLANLILKIATGEVEDKAPDGDTSDGEKNLTVVQRSEIAKKADKVRQKKV